MSNGIARASISIIFDEIILMFGFYRFFVYQYAQRYFTFSISFARHALSQNEIEICYLFLTSDSCHRNVYTLQIIDKSCASMLFYRRTLRFSHSICWHRVRAKFVRRISKSHYSHSNRVTFSFKMCIIRQHSTKDISFSLSLTLSSWRKKKSTKFAMEVNHRSHFDIDKSIYMRFHVFVPIKRNATEYTKLEPFHTTHIQLS